MKLRIIVVVVLLLSAFGVHFLLADPGSVSIVFRGQLIEMSVPVFVGLAIRNIRLYPLLKFALAAVIAVPLCFALANFIRQLPLARRIL